MNELLKSLYDNFYEPLPETELKKEIEDCHQQLIEALDKPERRLCFRSLMTRIKSLRTGQLTASSLGLDWRGV